MLNLMLALMAAQTAPEITPSLDSFSIATGVTGSCSGGHVATSATLRGEWTSTNYNVATQTYYVYEDGVLVSGQTASPYTKIFPGLKEGDPHHEQVYTSTWRVEIRRNSDNALLASREATVSTTYGDCSTGPV